MASKEAHKRCSGIARPVRDEMMPRNRVGIDNEAQGLVVPTGPAEVP